jgi:predicted metal-dependent peptidase
MASASIEVKLRAARARLAMDKPFLGALVLHLPLASARWCKTFATDARRIYFNPDYIGALSLAETQFVLAHAAMHCALGHFARRSHRLVSRWDLACDYAVNQLLVDEGLTSPAGALIDARFRGLSAEEIYPSIAGDVRVETLDTHAYEALASFDASAAERVGAKAAEATLPHEGALDAAFSDDALWSDAAPHERRSAGAQVDAPLPASTEHELLQAWQMRLAAAAQQARLAGRMSASWQRLLGQMITPVLPWRTLLARYVAQLARDDYSFQRPSRREGQALLPRLASGQLEVFAIIDTSGSIGAAQLHEFVTELDALKAQVRARVTLHACDEAMAPGGPWVAQTWEALRWPDSIAGGGGTSFAPAFEWIAQQPLKPDVLVYFTDAEGTFPEQVPPYPVLWLVKGRATVPWGERIQLN